MGVVPFFTKTPEEKFVIGLDFTDELPDGVTMTSGVASAINRKTELTATAVLLAAGVSVSISGNNATILIDDGVSGTWYEVHMTMTCSDASVIVGKAVVFIQ